MIVFSYILIFCLGVFFGLLILCLFTVSKRKASDPTLYIVDTNSDFFIPRRYDTKADALRAYKSLCKDYFGEFRSSCYVVCLWRRVDDVSDELICSMNYDRWKLLGDVK